MTTREDDLHGGVAVDAEIEEAADGVAGGPQGGLTCADYYLRVG